MFLPSYILRDNPYQQLWNIYIFFSLDLLDTKLTKTGNERRITKFSLKMQKNPKHLQKQNGERREEEGAGERGER